jgi:kumamolisin
VARFGPTTASVAKAESWLRQEGFSVGAVAKDRLFVAASGTAATVERAFGVQLLAGGLCNHRQQPLRAPRG